MIQRLRDLFLESKATNLDLNLKLNLLKKSFVERNLRVEIFKVDPDEEASNFIDEDQPLGKASKRRPGPKAIRKRRPKPAEDDDLGTPFLYVIFVFALKLLLLQKSLKAPCSATNVGRSLIIEES